MSRRKSRGLSADEMELWSRVIETAVPLQPKSAKIKPTKLFDDKKTASEKQSKPITAIFSPPSSKPIFFDPVGTAKPVISMDKKAFRKMTSGKLVPEAKIDLHGMTVAQAHPALTGFILRSHNAGKRLVLVITGKGRPQAETEFFGERGGVLRRQVPLWLQQNNLAPLVLQVATASKAHGGSGALYVYLRRAR